MSEELPFFTLKPNYNIYFKNNNETIGKLDFNQTPATFEGNLDESAKLLFQTACNMMDAKHRAYEAEIEALKAEAKEYRDCIVRVKGNLETRMVIGFDYDTGEYPINSETITLLLLEKQELRNENEQLKAQLSVALEALNKIKSIDYRGNAHESHYIATQAIQQIQGNKPYPLQKFRDSMKRRQDGNFDYPIEQQWSDDSWREIKIQGKGE